MKDFQLAKHFSFYELTRTDVADLQEANRKEAWPIRVKLGELADILEDVREACGHPLEIHSGFRGPALNGRIGGSKTSQHMLGEAADFSAPGEETDATIEQTFQNVLTALIAKALPFGQLIREHQDRGYRVSRWLHLSLGPPYRDALRCGEVLDMVAEKGKPGVYTLIKKVPVGR